METTQECGADGIIVYFQYVTFNFRIKVNTQVTHKSLFESHALNVKKSQLSVKHDRSI